MIRKISYAFIGIILLPCIAYALIPTATLYQSLIKLERGISGLAVHQIQIDDSNIEYLRGGDGTPLLLIHGFGADKDNWTRMARHLVDHYDVIALDLPGFGNSSKDINSDYDVLSQVTRVKKFVDALKVNHFHIAGNSMGGYIAGNFAALHPDYVKTLWLLNPFGVAESKLSEMFLITQRGGNPMVLPRTEAEFRQLFDFLFVNPPFIPYTIVEYLGQQTEQSVPLNTKSFHQIHQLHNGVPRPEYPLDVVLKNYLAPVLIMWGEKDRVLHVSGATTLKKHLPQAHMAIMPDTGHMPMVESPRETAELFLSFSQSR